MERPDGRRTAQHEHQSKESGGGAGGGCGEDRGRQPPSTRAPVPDLSLYRVTLSC